MGIWNAAGGVGRLTRPQQVAAMPFGGEWHIAGIRRTVNDPDATNLMAILLVGSNAPLPIGHAFMSPFARVHSDDELAAVVNFVNASSATAPLMSPRTMSIRRVKPCPSPSSGTAGVLS
jgi:hypothetical protein